jgi:hypothetical protein
LGAALALRRAVLLHARRYEHDHLLRLEDAGDGLWEEARGPFSLPSLIPPDVGDTLVPAPAYEG